MSFDPWQPQASGQPHTDAGFKPADEDVIRTLTEIEKASAANPLAATNTPIGPGTGGSTHPRTLPPAVFIVAALSVATAVLAFTFVGRQIVLSSGRSGRVRGAGYARSYVDSSMQAEAEQLLQRLASGDAGAAGEILERSAGWTGRTQRSATATQSITIALNRPELHVREAAVRAQLALDGVTEDEEGLKFVEQEIGDPKQRGWALWMLGALGNRGVDPVHSAKVIQTYLSDPAVDVRASALNGLALVGTDETIPMMLDRFRNDPSPVVQERAACALAESGMYTHEQRMRAAASLVSWLDDPLINGPQRAWTLHALRDISGQNFGTDSAAWRNWYEGSR